MRTRDPEARKERLLLAALSEFAAHGLAGSRMDRIAKAAGVSQGLAYSFYEGKAEMFDAIFDEIVAQTVATVPIDADDLPGYAVALHDASEGHPDVVRFLHWYGLEREGAGDRASSARSMAEKIATIEDAQHRGVVTASLPAPQILAAVVTLANMWSRPGGDFHAIVDADDRRDAVRAVVAKLVAPERRDRAPA